MFRLDATMEVVRRRAACFPNPKKNAAEKTRASCHATVDAPAPMALQPTSALAFDSTC